MEVTIGGNRLGAGNKMKASFRNYERSTHDLGYIWRSTMSAGTLVPFMSELMLPGDTFDINLGCSILTHPTIGPLFGSYKAQLDVFQVPLRLYQAELHMNMLNIGMKMNTIKLPQVEIWGTNKINPDLDIDNQQINPSSIFSYLGTRGLGLINDVDSTEAVRRFNAVPYLAYWSIYKQYYANKQEGIGAVIHTPVTKEALTLDEANTIPNDVSIPITDVYTGSPIIETFEPATAIAVLSSTALVQSSPVENICLYYKDENDLEKKERLNLLFEKNYYRFSYRYSNI